ARRRGVTYPLALSSASERGSPAGVAAATSTRGFRSRRVNTAALASNTVPVAAAKMPSRLPAFPVLRERSSILSDERSGCRVCVDVPMRSSQKPIGKPWLTSACQKPAPWHFVLPHILPYQWILIEVRASTYRLVRSCCAL